MNNKIVKTIDEHNIDRDANVLFAFDLDGSDYVCYRISRDEEQDNIFISKLVKNIDGTFNMINIDDINEKSKLNTVVMALVKGAIESASDKLTGDSISLSDGKNIKFISVNFNKEQRIEVKKTYVTTVKKEVTRVSEKYYAVEVAIEQPVVEDIFPTITPVQEEVKIVEPVVVAPTPVVVQEPTVVVAAPVVPEPVSVIEQPVAVQTVVQPTPQVVPVTPTPVVVEPITVAAQPQPAVAPSQPVISQVDDTPAPIVVAPEPVPASVSVLDAQPLVFNASKESNLNAALGEVANTATIPTQDLSPVREFGVDTPVAVQTNVQSQPAVAPMVQPEVSAQPKTLSKKAGFANSKFFMVVAIAFFLASCIFLGYEVFQYFQITK